MEIQKIHEDILSFLIKKRNEDSSLTFLVRNNNRGGRLDKGYWFLGNEGYAVVSFWGGTDWKNRTPNIFFRVHSDGTSLLELTSKDSIEKRAFFDDVLSENLTGLERKGKKWLKYYKTFGKDYLASLDQFLIQDKAIIDYQLINLSQEWEKKIRLGYNSLASIPEEKFRLRFANILSRRKTFREPPKLRIPISIKQFGVKDLGPIKELNINNLNSENQWIFFTGMNGTGKTSILKSLASGLCSNSDMGDKIFKTENFSINYVLNIEGEEKYFYFSPNSNYKNEITCKGLAVYGSARQRIRDPNDDSDPWLTSIVSNLFRTNGALLDLNQQLQSWRSGQTKQLFGNLEERIDQIVDLLTHIIPSLVSIRFELVEGVGRYETRYVEEDEFEDHLPSVTFVELASGVKSLVAMIGDMLLRLSAQQPTITDPSELKGIVIIDEIDIHLHPVLQKRLVELLTETFPYIQFVASTHSPIPLLGAPYKSVIYSVTRNKEKGVAVKRIRNIDLKNLLPNALLTSPVFGMDTLIPKSNESEDKVVVDDHYDDKALFKVVDKRIDELFEKGKLGSTKYFK